MTLPFVKMHGLGNDYVYVDGFAHDVPNPKELAPRIANRHFGVGGDGLILVLPPRPGVDAHCRMRMFNLDGSEGEMCGNGIRCVCKFAHDHELFPGARDARPMRIDTDNGVLTLDYQLDSEGLVDAVRVNMGGPEFNFVDIPVDTQHTRPTSELSTVKLEVEGHGEIIATCLSTGNPHAVVFAESLEQFENYRRQLQTLGPKLETHPAFPKRANIHFVLVRDPHLADVLHWERGSGATLACGTGASAVCVAGVLTGKTQRRLTARLPGGPLELEWDEPSRDVFMTGPARQAFTGIWHG
ncbi:MAG: diaminopimelate epimerase [Planctomycetota bacterium]